MAPMAPSDKLDAAWLASRRWFRSKARKLRSVTVHDQATLPAGGALLILDAAFADGGHEHYTVPAWPAADGFREPGDGDGLWRELVALMADGGRQLEGRQG